MFVMTAVCKNLFFALLLTAVAFSQTELKLSRGVERDSSRVRLSLNPLLRNDSFSDNMIFEETNFPFVLPGTSTSRIYSKMYLSTQWSGISDKLFSSEEMIKPLFTKFSRENKNYELNYVLGILQGAAVGYMAYRHISKWGFLRKKDD